MIPKPGKYRHYKGATVKVIGIAYHSETLEEMVVYIDYVNDPKLGKNPMFVRPKKMFLEKVAVNGKKVLRFKYIG
jgi:hypothetical protein